MYHRFCFSYSICGAQVVEDCHFVCFLGKSKKQKRRYNAALQMLQKAVKCLHFAVVTGIGHLLVIIKYFQKRREIPVIWQDYITMDADVLCGKPILKGTRISVEFVLHLLAAGWDRASLQIHYPNLTDDRIQAVLAYVADIFKNERFYWIPSTVKSA